MFLIPLLIGAGIATAWHQHQRLNQLEAQVKAQQTVSK